jgi:hypothetical protein
MGALLPSDPVELNHKQTNQMTQSQRYRSETPSPYAMHRRWLLEDDCEHDDRMTAEDYDRRSAERDGWQTGTWDGR